LSGAPQLAQVGAAAALSPPAGVVALDDRWNVQREGPDPPSGRPTEPSTLTTIVSTLASVWAWTITAWGSEVSTFVRCSAVVAVIWAARRS
jgi:hypothetical protein